MIAYIKTNNHNNSSDNNDNDNTSNNHNKSQLLGTREKKAKTFTEIKQTKLETNNYESYTRLIRPLCYHVLNPPEKQLHN